MIIFGNISDFDFDYIFIGNYILNLLKKKMDYLLKKYCSLDGLDVDLRRKESVMVEPRHCIFRFSSCNKELIFCLKV